MAGPYSDAVAAGKCPLCLGHGEQRPTTIVLTEPMTFAGDPCTLCIGTGKWPPPEPLMIAILRRNDDEEG